MTEICHESCQSWQCTQVIQPSAVKPLSAWEAWLLKQIVYLRQHLSKKLSPLISAPHRPFSLSWAHSERPTDLRALFVELQSLHYYLISPPFHYCRRTVDAGWRWLDILYYCRFLSSFWAKWTHMIMSSFMGQPTWATGACYGWAK